MSCIFINSTSETFTPTKSGALSTWTWEMCRVAERHGVRPLVITKTNDAKPYPWPRTIFLDYPWVPRFRGTGLGRLIKIQQRLTGWGHPRQKAYALKVVRAIRKAGASELPMVLQNDPEMAVFLRRRFPHAFIIHNFQNCNECQPNFRAEFARAVNVASAVSQYCAAWNERYFGFPPGGVHVLYNAVDTDRFFPATEPPPEPALISFVGRTDQQKAPDLLLRAAILVAQQTKDFRLQILGSRFYGWSEPDAYQAEIETLAQDLERRGIEVNRPGFVNRHDLPEQLQKAHINVVPSRWDEPFGLVTLEGMACGLATVASRTGGTPEIVSDSGLLFERNSVEGLAKHLLQLITNRELRLELGRKARDRAEEFTWQRTWCELEGLFARRSAATTSREPLAAVR